MKPWVATLDEASRSVAAKLAIAREYAASLTGSPQPPEAGL